MKISLIWLLTTVFMTGGAQTLSGSYQIQMKDGLEGVDQCLHRGGTFCPSLDYSSGFCCDKTDDCDPNGNVNRCSSQT